MQIYRKINKDTFINFIEKRGVSIRSLDRVSGVTERTIRRSLKYGEISISSAIRICLYLDCTFDEAFGVDSSSEWNKIISLFIKE